MYLVYLAGPIRGLSHEETTSWREYVIDNFPDQIQGLSPMRGKHYLKGTEDIQNVYEDWPLSGQRGIYARDKFDCTRADVVLVNLLGAKNVSIGTVMEIAWAAGNNIPVVLIMEEGNVHNHPMICEACPFIVDTVDEAIDVTTALLLPVPH